MELEELEKLCPLVLSAADAVWAAALSENPMAKAEAAINMRRSSGQ